LQQWRRGTTVDKNTWSDIASNWDTYTSYAYAYIYTDTNNYTNVYTCHYNYLCAR
jgi:hypothetical protein